MGVPALTLTPRTASAVGAPWRWGTGRPVSARAGTPRQSGGTDPRGCGTVRRVTTRCLGLASRVAELDVGACGGRAEPSGGRCQMVGDRVMSADVAKDERLWGGISGSVQCVVAAGFSVGASLARSATGTNARGVVVDSGGVGVLESVVAVGRCGPKRVPAGRVPAAGGLRGKTVRIRRGAAAVFGEVRPTMPLGATLLGRRVRTA